MMIYLIIFLAVISRFVPHTPNFAPITALAIFAAAHMPWQKAAGLILVIRLVSDLFLGFFSWPLMLAVYGSHLMGIVFGVWVKNSSQSSARNAQVKGLSAQKVNAAVSPSFLKRGLGGVKIYKILISSVGASLIFFLATNFAFFYSNYPHNFSGIVQSYLNGLPFLRGTLLGDLFYSFALFGVYKFVKNFHFFIKSNMPYLKSRSLNDQRC